MNKGVIYGLVAYFLWGFYPIYFKALHIVPPLQILTHRVVWSFFTLLLVLAARKELVRLKNSLTMRVILIYFAAGVLLAINWGTYVWAVNAGHVVESSLGYFINPLVSVLLGVLILREKLRSWQWLPVGLATLGVLYLTFSYGQLPWIALVLAFSFGTYGLVKKIAPLNSMHGLSVETTAIFIPALIFLFIEEFRGAGSFVHAGTSISLLLAMAGPVTVIPLIFFATAARLIPLSTMGILQYVAPTLQFLIGVFIYHEPFTTERLIGFIVIWIALIIFSIEGLLHQRHLKTAKST